ncbi:MAG: secretin and TonB N-terminal domain-containing protein, partial [Syntrophales bacterium]|nr:secretin and TonB N-terminal domain-containing protein [Syntrophales bacterium]
PTPGGTKGGLAPPRKDDPQPERGSQYTGEEVSLDFQDADIKSVFRLLSEISGFSIIAGPEVTSEVTVHMKNVPWDQALDAVLEINGLGKKQSGRVITVLPLEALKKAKEEQKEKDVTQGRLKQVSIEAKIVEVTANFAQELGIRWGAGLSSGNFAAGIGSAASGTTTPIGGGVGLTGSGLGVNFPSLASATPAIGLLYGTSRMILDAKLSALEASGNGKIISSPKVTTLDSVKATIKQGEEIPYTVTDKDGNSSTEFKDAVLKLEVTPTITPEGRISIVVSASNDYADWQTDSAGDRVENPPINTSSVQSSVVVRDGDTIVIGGVYKTIASETVSGVPGLSQIPVLGWLFKYKTTTTEKRELLIFLTPKVVTEEG